LDLLQKAWECGELESEPGQHFTEQDCLLRLIEDNVLHAREKSVIVRQWKMNAFPKEIPCYDDAKTHWEEGMFVIHFAGAWAHVKADDPTGVLMRKYQEYVV
jgi:mannan polymerase II complex MNN10 subunit